MSGETPRDEPNALVASLRRLHKPIGVWDWNKGKHWNGERDWRFGPPRDEPQREPDHLRCRACHVHDGCARGALAIYEPWPCPTMRIVNRLASPAERGADYYTIQRLRERRVARRCRKTIRGEG